MNNIEIIEQLYLTQNADREQLVQLIKSVGDDETELLRQRAQEVARRHFKNGIYIRGLIEISSCCKNDCLYCGLRHSNRNAVRYRLGREEILACCARGYELGFRTFVLQGGEDSYFSDDVICGIVSDIRKAYPDCAITLSLGERGGESFQRLFDAGADRYLLRHETADPRHYVRLHPKSMSYVKRVKCLWQLKQIGYQTGAGFMVGSPYQTAENLADDLIFIKEIEPQMCGIGPFIPHHDTEFRDFKQGSLRQTLIMLSLVRLMNPKILLPSTTALATIDPKGRELGILHGANVVMPNLSPPEHRSDYSIYDNKRVSGTEAAESVRLLDEQLNNIGYKIITARGDYEQ